MRIASLFARYLLGLMFTVFGLKGFLHFIHQPPPQAALAVQFMTAASESHFLVLVFFVQTLAGVLLLVGRYVPLALTLLAAVMANILNYHLTMDPRGIGPGAFTVILWFIIFLHYRRGFVGLLQAKPEAA